MKRALWTSDSTAVEVPGGLGGGGFTFSRAQMDVVLEPRFKEIRAMVDLVITHYKTIRTARPRAELPDVPHAVLLVGGASRMQGLHPLLAVVCPKIVRSSDFGVSEDEAIAIGAALRGAALCGARAGRLQRSAPHSISVGLANGEVLVLLEKGTPLPCSSDPFKLTNSCHGRHTRITLLEGDEDHWHEGEAAGNIRTGAASRNLRTLYHDVDHGKLEEGKADMEVQCSYDAFSNINCVIMVGAKVAACKAQGLSKTERDALRDRLHAEVSGVGGAVHLPDWARGRGASW